MGEAEPDDFKEKIIAKPQQIIHAEILRPRKVHKLTFQFPLKTETPSVTSVESDTVKHISEIPPRLSLIDSEKFEFNENQAPLVDGAFSESYAESENLDSPGNQNLSLVSSPKQGPSNNGRLMSAQAQNLPSVNAPKRTSLIRDNLKAPKKENVAVDTSSTTSITSDNVDGVRNPLTNQGLSSDTKEVAKMKRTSLESPPASSYITSEKMKMEKLALETTPEPSSTTKENPKMEIIALKILPSRGSVIVGKVKTETMPLENQPTPSSHTSKKKKMETTSLEKPPARSISHVIMEKMTLKKPPSSDNLKTETTPLKTPPIRGSITLNIWNTETTPVDDTKPQYSSMNDKSNVAEAPLANNSPRESITHHRKLHLKRISLEMATARSSITGKKIRIHKATMESLRRSISSGKLIVHGLPFDQVSIRSSIDSGYVSSSDHTIVLLDDLPDFERKRSSLLSGRSLSNSSAGSFSDNMRIILSDTLMSPLGNISASRSNSIIYEEKPREIIKSGVRLQIDPPCPPGPARKQPILFQRNMTIQKHFEPIKTKPLKITYADLESLEIMRERRKLGKALVRPLPLPYSNVKGSMQTKCVKPPTPPAIQPNLVKPPTQPPDKNPVIKHTQKDKLVLPAIHVKKTLVSDIRHAASERDEREAKRIENAKTSRRKRFAMQKNVIPNDVDPLNLSEILTQHIKKVPNKDTRSVRGIPKNTYVGVNTKIWPKFPIAINLYNLANKDNYYHNLSIRRSINDSCEQSSCTYRAGVSSDESSSEKEIFYSALTSNKKCACKASKRVTSNKDSEICSQPRKATDQLISKTTGDDPLIDPYITQSEMLVRVPPKYGRRAKPNYDTEVRDQDNHETPFFLTELKSEPEVRPVPKYGRRSKPPVTSESLSNTEFELKNDQCKIEKCTFDTEASKHVRKTPHFGRRSLTLNDTNETQSSSHVRDRLDQDSTTKSRPLPTHGRRASESSKGSPLLTTETESLPTVLKLKQNHKFTPRDSPTTRCREASTSRGDSQTISNVGILGKTYTDKVECTRPQIKGLAKMNKKQLEEYRQQLLYKLPTYKEDDILILRKSYDEFICKRLEEDNLPEASLFIRKVVNYDTERRKCVMEGVRLGQPLKHNQVCLNRLDLGLRESAEACDQGRYGFASEIFLRMAVIFMQNDEWWWLSQQLFDISITFGQKVRDLLAKHEAMARYIFGMFLLKSFNNIDEAEEHLSIASNLSIGKSWKAKILGPDQDTIFHECSSLLNNIFTKRSVSALEDEGDPRKAKKLAFKAMKMAEASDKSSSRLQSMFQLARCHRASNDLNGAMKILKIFIADCAHVKDFDRLCNGHRELAECLLEQGDAYELFASLLRYRSVAKSHQRKAHQAEASLYIGRFHWGQKQLPEALNFVREAFVLFFQLNMMEELEIARSLYSMIKGEQVLPHYARLVRRSQRDEYCSSLHLNWKDRHYPFWMVNFHDKKKKRSVVVDQTETLSNSPKQKSKAIRFASKK